MRRYILILLMFLCAYPLFAQRFSINVDAPRVVALGEPFRVEFKMNKRPDSFVAPDFKGFDILAGPTIAEGRSVEISQGKTVTNEEYTYTYVLLANSEGNVAIKEATASSGGVTVKSRSIPIELVKDAARASDATSNASSNAKQTIAADDILLIMSVDRSSLYKGEAVIATLKLATRIDLAGIEGAKYPSFNGFWVQEYVEDTPWIRETISNKIYDTKVLKKYILFPQKSGELAIDMMSMDVLARIVVQSSQRGNSLFDNFFGGGAVTQDIRRKVDTKRIVLNIKELPTPVPASFSGAVGEFNFSGSLSSDILTANSSGNLTLKISGNGNLPLVSEPVVKLPSSFEAYKVKSTESINSSSSGVSGEKVFEYPFIVRAAGTYQINPIEFTYFDPKKEGYTTISTRTMDLGVSIDTLSGAAGSNNTTIYTGVTKEELKILGNDIRYIITSPVKFYNKGSFFIFSNQYLLILFGVILLFASSVIWYSKNRKFNRDVVRVKSSKARKMALGRLKIAKSYMNGVNDSQFHQEILKALWGYVGDKLNIEVAMLSKSNISEALSYKGVSNELIEKYLELIQDCEYAQYAPGNKTSIESVYNNSIEVISNLEEKI